MSRINPLAREILTKVVYYGPGVSGKTTSLKYVHDALPPARRGEFVSLATETDRTIFFDFLPVRVTRIRNLTVRLALYTVPGQSFYAATRKLVLNGADGVVFVADSRRSAKEANKEALADLEANLAELGLSLSTFPHVFQFNKRDLDGVMSVAEMSADLNRHGAQAFESAATRGVGVVPALKAIIQRVIQSLGGEPAGSSTSSASSTQTSAKSRTAEPRSAEGTTQEFVLGSGEPRPRGERDSAAPAPAPSSALSAPLAPQGAPLSFAPLWPANDAVAIGVVEQAIAMGNYSLAVITAAEILAEMLENMPGVPKEEGAVARGMLLGVDGHWYLRLCKLASAPSETLTVNDALFALHVVVDARLKLLSV